MDQEPLSPDSLRESIPELETVGDCFARGGLKWVYRCTVSGREEALKVVVLREIDDPTADPDFKEAMLREQIARVRREIEAKRGRLESCDRGTPPCYDLSL